MSEEELLRDLARVGASLKRQFPGQFGQSEAAPTSSPVEQHRADKDGEYSPEDYNMRGLKRARVEAGLGWHSSSSPPSSLFPPPQSPIQLSVPPNLIEILQKALGTYPSSSSSIPPQLPSFSSSSDAVRPTSAKLEPLKSKPRPSPPQPPSQHPPPPVFTLPPEYDEPVIDLTGPLVPLSELTFMPTPTEAERANLEKQLERARSGPRPTAAPASSLSGLVKDHPVVDFEASSPVSHGLRQKMADHYFVQFKLLFPTKKQAHLATLMLEREIKNQCEGDASYRNISAQKMGKLRRQVAEFQKERDALRAKSD